MMKPSDGIVFKGGRTFRRMLDAYAETASGETCSLAETAKCEEPLENLRMDPTARIRTGIRLKAKIPSHVCDSHFRAFLLITQARTVVKTISDDRRRWEGTSVILPEFMVHRS
jgi:hypothetical protein